MEDGCVDSVRSGSPMPTSAEGLQQQHTPKTVRTGSSGEWNLELSSLNHVETPAPTQEDVRWGRSPPSPAVLNPTSGDLWPENHDDDAAGGTPPAIDYCLAEAGMQHSFILRPHDAHDLDAGWAKPGRRFFAATSASFSLPRPTDPTQPQSRLLHPMGRSVRRHSVGPCSWQGDRQVGASWTGNRSVSCIKSFSTAVELVRKEGGEEVALGAQRE